MGHFVIEFIATINGLQVERGKIGSVSGDENDYQPNSVKKTIEQHYRNIIPDAKSVAVVLHNVQKVSSEQYYEQSKSFIRLGQDN